MLEERIFTDLKTAMKEKNTTKTATLRLLISAIKNARIEQHTDALDDATIIKILKRQAKQRHDSIEQFTKAGRNDLSTQEAAELTIIKTYLPEELSKEEIEQLVTDTMKELNAHSMKDIGRVMKAIIKKSNGRADNALISTLVKEKLQ